MKESKPQENPQPKTPETSKKFNLKNIFLPALNALVIGCIMGTVYHMEVEIPNQQKLKESNLTFVNAENINSNLKGFNILVGQNELTQHNPEEIKRVLNALEVVIGDWQPVREIVEQKELKLIFVETLSSGGDMTVFTDTAIYIKTTNLFQLSDIGLQSFLAHEFRHIRDRRVFFGLGKYLNVYNSQSFTKTNNAPNQAEQNAIDEESARSKYLGQPSIKKYGHHPKTYLKNPRY